MNVTNALASDLAAWQRIGMQALHELHPQIASDPGHSNDFLAELILVCPSSFGTTVTLLTANEQAAALAEVKRAIGVLGEMRPNSTFRDEYKSAYRICERRTTADKASADCQWDRASVDYARREARAIADAHGWLLSDLLIEGEAMRLADAARRERRLADDAAYEEATRRERDEAYLNRAYGFRDRGVIRKRGSRGVPFSPVADGSKPNMIGRGLQDAEYAEKK